MAPVIVLDHLTEQRRRAYRIADNMLNGSLLIVARGEKEDAVSA